MTLPRRLEPSTLEKLAVTATRMTPGAAGGISRHVHRGNTSALSTQAQSGIVVVVHGDNPDVDRPDAAVVRWVGAATPNNAVDYDDWYPADVVG